MAVPLFSCNGGHGCTIISHAHILVSGDNITVTTQDQAPQHTLVLNNLPEIPFHMHICIDYS